MTEIDVARLRSEYKGPHELVSTSDGKSIFVRKWPTTTVEPKASVLIMHGITAHSGPYGPMVADQLSNSGFEVFGMDLRGHGLSDGKRGDYPSAERFVNDLTETLRLVKSKSERLVVMGHSLGVLTAIVATKNSPNDVDGLVLVSAAKKVRTGVFPKPGTGARLKALVGVALLRGSPLIEYRREGQLGINDPLFTFHYSARFYSILYGAGALKVMGMLRSGLIDSPNLAFDRRLHIPLFVAIGEDDELFSVDAAREFCDGIDCDDKEFQSIPGARHALWPKNAFKPLVDWLGRKF
jgi:acylglycerol lipase